MEAVIFDMDGVLTDTINYHYLSWKQALEEYGIPFTPRENDLLRGLTRRRSLEVALGDRQLTEIQKRAILEKKNRYFKEYLAQMSERDLLPGVRRLLEELRQAGIKTGVASASHNAPAILAHLGVLEWIDATVDGNQVQSSKPAPDSFLAAARSLGVEPRDCLAIEDSTAGVRAAHAAGMCVIGLGPLERVGEADAVFPGLAEVRLSDLRQVHRRKIS